MILSKLKKEEWLIFAAVAVVVFFVLTRKKTTGNKSLLNQNDNQKVLNKNPKKILIVGDSYSVPSSKYTWSSLLKKELEPQGIEVDILAQGGQTTAWMLKKMTEALKTKKYDRVYAWGGTNDGANGVKTEVAISNLQKMSDLAKENNTDLFILKGYVFEGYFSIDKLIASKGFPNVSRQQWEQISQNIRNVKAKINKDNIKGANFIEEFNLGDKTGDGSHPNGEAHKIIKNVVLATI